VNGAPILVIGARGKTGRSLTRQLREAGSAHVAGVRSPGSAGGSPEVHFDWDEPVTWTVALSGARRLYLVKPPPDRDPVVAVQALLASHRGLERVVLLSEMLREEKPDAEPHREVERLVETCGVEAVILRPNWFMQNWSAEGGYCASIVLRDEIVLPSGDARAALIDVQDVSDVAFRALTDDEPWPRWLELTGAEAVSMSGLAAAISHAVGRRVVHRSPDLDEVRTELISNGANPWQLEYLVDLYADFQAGGFARTTDTVEQILGHPPRTLDAFVRDHLGDWTVGGPPDWTTDDETGTY